MKTYINTKEFQHLPELSHYNYNVYENTTNGICVLEKCDDCNNFGYYYYDKVNKKEGEYLGLYQFDSIFDSKVDVVELDSDIW